MKKVAMIGVGKLGQDCAEIMALHNDVVGYDVEPRLPFFPMVDTIEEAVKDRDFIFIAAPTPHDPKYGGETPTSHLPNKDFDYTIVTDILTEVNKYVNKNQLVILISTVLPGTVRRQLEPCITNARFIYNPYLIAMGTIKWDMVNPEMVIIGTEDGSITGDAKELIEFYQEFMENDPRYEVGTWDEAESIKIFYNTFISAKLALVNMVQDVAETNGNINVDVVTSALAKSTTRIMGPAYMKAGLGDAGACHPRDNIALRDMSKRLDLGYDLFDTVMRAREVQAERMALRCLKNGTNITIIGKAYKPGVPYTNGSASMLVGYYIEKHGGFVNYYDLNTGDTNLKEGWTHVYLIGYWEPYVESITFSKPEAVVIDPWRKITTRQHTGEIIHYGNSRKKYMYEPHSSTIPVFTGYILAMWPELNEYIDQVHIIDATIAPDTTFILRPTETIVEEIKQAHANGKTKFFFYALTEAVMPHVIGKIQRIASILSKTIDAEDLFYLSGASDGQQAYNKYQYKNKISILSAQVFQYFAQHTNKGYESMFPTEYEVRAKEKTFLCFNKVNREHRMLLLERMLENNFVSNGFYSFEGEDNWMNEIDTLTDDFKHIKENKSIFPLRLNITRERSNPVTIWPEDLKYFAESYFSIVTETFFFSRNQSIHRFHQPLVDDSMFITEKTYKCLTLMHPFVLFARPGMLAELRKIGYKTFSPMIDESYDAIEGDGERFNAAWAEIHRLMLKTPEEWIEWQTQIKDIVEFNRAHFYANKNYEATPISRFFLEKVIEPPIEESIILMPLTDDLDWTLQNTTLTSGIVMQYPTLLDGGGLEMKDNLISVIKSSGKHFYDRGYEWCCGFGALGFEVLGMGIAKHMVFSDYYHVATDTCVEIAKNNQLSNYISAHVSPSISGIPASEKWDLVISNPPHVPDKHEFLNQMNALPTEHHYLDNTCRLTVDEDWSIHKEFFKNIRSKLTLDADVYLIEAVHNEDFIKWAEEGGLVYQEKFYPVTFLPHGRIYHFKVKQ